MSAIAAVISLLVLMLFFVESAAALGREVSDVHDVNIYWVMLLLIFTSIAITAGVLLSRTDQGEVSDYQDQFCQTCGYDLRATPDRCPECGDVPTKGKNSN